MPAPYSAAPFRGRKRHFRDNFAPGGTKTDPLGIAIDLAADPEAERQRLGISTTPERPKRRKLDDDSSPGKHRDHSPKKTNKHLTKDAKEAVDLRKNKRDYFNRKFRYGNFDRYYGVRLNPGDSDRRLSVFSRDWFEKKSILDIGCNVGFLTLSIAKDFEPRRILGIDIDEHLIGVARKNIRHYCDHETVLNGKYPASFGSNFGPISQHSEPRSFSTKFPDNVWFKKENYVLESDAMLDMVTPEFDVIMALSITKWIHLNWGDDGMRRFLRRAYKHLMPGGRLIIEPQVFESYRKRAKMSEELLGNYHKIEFKPDDFEMYLIEEIGFENVEHLGAPSAKSKGFERSIDVYLKPLKEKPRDEPITVKPSELPQVALNDAATPIPKPIPRQDTASSSEME